MFSREYGGDFSCNTCHFVVHLHKIYNYVCLFGVNDHFEQKTPPLETGFEKSMWLKLTFKIVHNISPYLTFVLPFFWVEKYTWWSTWLWFHLSFKSVSKLKHICLSVKECKEMNPNAPKWIFHFSM